MFLKVSSIFGYLPVIKGIVNKKEKYSEGNYLEWCITFEYFKANYKDFSNWEEYINIIK